MQRINELRASGELKVTDETRKRMSEGQRRRYKRPEEMKKLERARNLSYQVIDFVERVKMMHEAFLAKCGSFTELAKMGLRAPRRKPNKLEMEAVKILGDAWRFVGKGDLVIGGLIPDFIHEQKRVVLEVLGCYFHACPQHFPNVRVERSARVDYREAVFKKNGYDVVFLWEHDIKKRRKLAFKDAGVKDPSIYAK